MPVGSADRSKVGDGSMNDLKRVDLRGITSCEGQDLGADLTMEGKG